MPALAGEPLRGQSVVQIRNDISGASNMRGYTVSIDDVNPVASAPGDQDFTRDPTTFSEVISVTLRFEWDSIGTPIAEAATDGTLRVRLPGSGSDIGSTVTLTPAGNSGSETFTLRFDANPLDASVDAARWGTLEILFQVSRSGLGSWGPADSRGAYSSQVVATSNFNARGYIRRTALLADHSLSNVSFGGAEPSLWAYPDTIFERATLDAIAYRSSIITFDWRQGGVSKTTANSNNTTAIDRDASSDQIDEEFDSANATADLRLTQEILDFGGDNEHAWAATGHQAGFSFISLTSIENLARITVDPRITIAHLLRLNDNTFATPPLSEDAPEHDRLTSDLGFAAWRAQNSRNEGQNGLTGTQTLVDIQELVTPIVSTSQITATRGGEDGWSPYITWDSQLPTGDWTHTVDITAPSDADTLEESAIDDGFTITKVSSTLQSTVHLEAPNGSTHWEPGIDLIVSAHLFNIRDLNRLTIDSADAILLRINASTGRLEHLTTLPDTWATFDPTDNFVTFPLSAHASDARLFTRTFTTTTLWTDDVVALVIIEKSGSRSYSTTAREIVGRENKHNKYVLDTVGFALSNVLGQR